MRTAIPGGLTINGISVLNTAYQATPRIIHDVAGVDCSFAIPDPTGLDAYSYLDQVPYTTGLIYLPYVGVVPLDLEIFAKEAGKGNGLRFLCDYLNVPVVNSIAAGDAQNDISMLEAAGLSVAMCNGDEDIKAMADVVTKRDNHECGLADVVYEFIL